MWNNPRPINSIAFLNELPALYSRDDGEGSLLFQRFLMQFEEMFDDLESAIVGDALTLTYKGEGTLKSNPDKTKRRHGDHRRGRKSEAEIMGYPLAVELFNAGHIGYPKSSGVFIPGTAYTTTLSEPIYADDEDISVVYVTNGLFSSNLKPGDKFVVRTSSGISGLTSIREMPPISFRYLGQENKLAYLQYIASWVGLPLRADKTIRWNRRFLREAVAFDNNPLTQRSTLPGLTALLNSWHHQEIESSSTIVTDLISPENETDTVFRIGECRIGVSTLLGEGLPGFFHVYLTTDSDDVAMRNPRRIGAMTAAAKLILELEKPMHINYSLYIRAHTMCLAPNASIAPYKNSKNPRNEEEIDEDEQSVKDTNTFARIGVTTLIWDS